MTAIVDYERELVSAAHRRARGDPAASRSTASPTRPASTERVPTVSVSIEGVAPAGRRRGARPRRHLRLGRRLLRDRAHRAARQGRVRRRPAARARPLQHRRRGRPDARGARADRGGRCRSSRATDSKPMVGDPDDHRPGYVLGRRSWIRATPTAGWTIWRSSPNSWARRPDPAARPSRQRGDPGARARLVPPGRSTQSRRLTAPSSSSRPACRTASTTMEIGRCRCRRSSRRPGSGSATSSGTRLRARSRTSPQAGATYDLRTGDVGVRRVVSEGRRSRRASLAGSTRPSCGGSSGCGSATRSPRTGATSTDSSPRSPPDCVYEIVPTGQRWEGHDGARRSTRSCSRPSRTTRSR